VAPCFLCCFLSVLSLSGAFDLGIRQTWAGYDPTPTVTFWVNVLDGHIENNNNNKKI
jgi:hypothetical protein